MVATDDESTVQIDNQSMNRTIDDDSTAVSSYLYRFAGHEDTDYDSQHTDGEQSRDKPMTGPIYEDDSIADDKNRRKTRKFLLALLVLIVLTIVALVIVKTTMDKKRRKRRKQGMQSGISAQGNIFGSPTASPTSAPTHNTAYHILAPLVQDHGKLLDLDTPQGKAFLRILEDGLTDPFVIVQRFALHVLYESTSPDDWFHDAGWMQGSTNSDDECMWFGVATCRVDDETNRKSVTNIALGGNNLIGEIPDEICLLEDLESINLGDNRLVGTLPDCFGTGLKQLEMLDVGGNFLEGELPIGLFSSSRKLEVVILKNNEFVGDLRGSVKVSEEDGEENEAVPFSNIRTVELDSNDFSSDPLPQEFLAFPVLEHLTLHRTSISVDFDDLCEHHSDAYLTTDCEHWTMCRCCSTCY